LLAEGRRREVADLYRRVFTLLLLLGLPVAAAVIAVGRPFLRLWAGPGYASHAYAPLAILVVGVAIDALGYVPSNLLYASHRAGRVLAVHAAQLAPYLVAVVLVTPRWGLSGAAVVWVGRATVNSCLYAWVASREVGTGWPISPGALGRVALSALVLVPVLLVAAVTSSLLAAAAASLVLLAAYAVVAERVGLTPDDRVWVRSFVPGRS
jgi:O-antigen/teichoic acid export membrane protein